MNTDTTGDGGQLLQLNTSSIGTMSGDVGDHNPTHDSVIYSCQQLDVTGWSFKPFV